MTYLDTIALFLAEHHVARVMREDPELARTQRWSAAEAAKSAILIYELRHAGYGLPRGLTTED